MAMEYLTLSNPSGLAVGVFIVLFAVAFYVLARVIRNKGSAVVVALVVSLIGSLNLYQNDFYGAQESILLIIYVAVAVLFLKMIISFFKFFGRGFKKARRF